MSRDAFSPVSRSPADSWAFNPAWRSELVESRVAELAAMPDRAFALQSYLYQQRDPFLRQGVRFRLTGACVCLEGFSWAYRAYDENVRTGMASALKAMVVADRFPEEIAEEFGTSPMNIAIFERLFWDVRPYLGNPMWLRALVAPRFQPPAATIAETRERLMLRTAFRGWPGLRAFLRGEPEDLDGGLEAIEEKIEKLAACLTLRYLEELEASGTALSEEDLKRFALLRQGRSRESVGKASEVEDHCQDFGRALRALVVRDDADPLPDTKALKALGRYLPQGGTDVEVIDPGERRRRRRDASWAA